MPFSRPNLPYQPQESLPNNQRFGLLGTRPPTASMVDAEFNALTDDVNNLQTQINNLVVGAIPGANDPENNNKLLASSNQSLAWTFIENINITPGAVTTDKINDEAVTFPKLGAGAVQSINLYPGAVTNDAVLDFSLHLGKLVKITPGSLLASGSDGVIDVVHATPLNSVLIGQDNNLPSFGFISDANIAPKGVNTVSLGDASVGTPQLIDANVTNLKIAPLAVDATKITSNGAATGTVLTSGAGSQAIWSAIPTITGQVLQIVSHTYSQRTATTGATNMSSFAVPFALTITPLSSNSRIFIYLGTNLASVASSGGYMTMALYKNGTQMLFDNNGILFSGYQPQSMYNDLVCFSRLIVDQNTSLNSLTYELKGADASGYGVILNQSSGTGTITSSSIYAVEVQI